MIAIRQLLASSTFSDLDRHFAAFIEAQDGGDRATLANGAQPLGCSNSLTHPDLRRILERSHVARSCSLRAALRPAGNEVLT